MYSLWFFIDLIIQPHCGRGVDLTEVRTKAARVNGGQSCHFYMPTLNKFQKPQSPGAPMACPHACLDLALCYCLQYVYLHMSITEYCYSKKCHLIYTLHITCYGTHVRFLLHLPHRPLACWDLGFESNWGHGYLSVVSVVRCQVEVSATSWSLVQRSPTECGASLCVI